MQTIARILISALLLPYFLVPIQSVSAGESFEFDGTFTGDYVQFGSPARAEQKASYTIAIGANNHPG